MQGDTRMVLTIVTEAVVERPLLRDLAQLGASAFTVSDVRGRGTHGLRPSDWSASSNIRVEVVCESHLAEAIVAHLQAHYAKHYAMFFYATQAVVPPRTGA